MNLCGDVCGYLVEFLQQSQCGNKIILIEDRHQQRLASRQHKHNDALIHVDHSGENTAVHKTPPVI